MKPFIITKIGDTHVRATVIQLTDKYAFYIIATSELRDNMIKRMGVAELFSDWKFSGFSQVS